MLLLETFYRATQMWRHVWVSPEKNASSHVSCLSAKLEPKRVKTWFMIEKVIALTTSEFHGFRSWVERWWLSSCQYWPLLTRTSFFWGSWGSSHWDKKGKIVSLRKKINFWFQDFFMFWDTFMASCFIKQL